MPLAFDKATSHVHNSNLLNTSSQASSATPISEYSVTDNDRIILDQILAQKRTSIDPSATESDFFEFFTAEQVLKDSDLSYDELESGLVGHGWRRRNRRNLPPRNWGPRPRRF